MVFAALADHSGDAGFELCYMPDMSAALDAFRDAGGPAAWLDRFWDRALAAYQAEVEKEE